LEQENKELFNKSSEVPSKSEDLFDGAEEVPQEEVTETTVQNENSIEVEEEEVVEAPPEEPEMKEVPEDVGMDLEEIEIGELTDSEVFEVSLNADDVEDKGTPEAPLFLSKKDYVIKSAKVSPPILKNANGPIPPTVFNDKFPDKKGYETKLIITYENSSYKSIIPKVKWYLGINSKNGKKMLNPYFFRNVKKEDLSNTFMATISKLYYKYCMFVKKVPGKVGALEFEKGLVGKKVKLSEYRTNFEGTDRTRLDVYQFLE